MPVDPEHLALIGREEMGGKGLALQLRRADDERDHGLGKQAAPISAARPMLPMAGLESKVEQTL